MEAAGYMANEPWWTHPREYQISEICRHRVTTTRKRHYEQWQMFIMHKVLQVFNCQISDMFWGCLRRLLTFCDLFHATSENLPQHYVTFLSTVEQNETKIDLDYISFHRLTRSKLHYISISHLQAELNVLSRTRTHANPLASSMFTSAIMEEHKVP
jgi:hypothetical protein